MFQNRAQGRAPFILDQGIDMSLDMPPPATSRAGTDGETALFLSMSVRCDRPPSRVIAAWPLALAILAGIAACAAVGPSVVVGSEATGSAYFSLGPPNAFPAGTGLRIVGRVCRRARSTLLSPAGVRLEHIGADGRTLDVAHARVAAIYRDTDQACADYAAKVDWRVVQGERIRACFNRGRPCPGGAAVKATIAVPAPSAPSP